MVDNQNPNVTNTLQNETMIGNSLLMPTKVNDNLQPVLISNPKKTINLFKSDGRTTTGTSTLYNTSSSKDTYLWSAWLLQTSDAACDGVTFLLTATPKNDSARNLIVIKKQTLTAGSDHTELDFSAPILLERGSAINITSSFTVGANSMSGAVFLEEVDNIREN